MDHSSGLPTQVRDSCKDSQQLGMSFVRIGAWSLIQELIELRSAFVFLLAILAQVNRWLNIRYPPTELVHTNLNKSEGSESAGGSRTPVKGEDV